MEVAIVGVGFVGLRLAELLSAHGHSVYGLRRTYIQQTCYRFIAADLTDAEQLADSLPQTLTHLVFCAAPGKSEPALDPAQRAAAYERVYVAGCKNLVKAAARLPHLQRSIFVSSTSVYSEATEGVVSEATPAQPTHWNGRCILAAEQAFAELPGQSAALRCAGIYGPGRTRLVDSVRRGEASYDPLRPHYMNRIHRDDVAAALFHLLQLPHIDPLYLGVDLDTASDAEVLTWLSQRLNAPLPKQVDMPSTRAGKRCSSDKLRASGYQFIYPSFRDGYGAMLGAVLSSQP